MIEIEHASRASFNAAKKHADLISKYEVPWQVWDAPKAEDDGCGASATVTLERANNRLAPFNMVIHAGLRRWALSVLNDNQTWPSNWSSIADAIVMLDEDVPLKTARLGRSRWVPLTLEAA